MKLNGKKFEHLHYGKQHKSNSYFTEESKIIKEKEVVKDLGVMISNDTNYKAHINGVIKRATQLVGWIMRTFKSRDKEVMLVHCGNHLSSPISTTAPNYGIHSKKGSFNQLSKFKDLSQDKSMVSRI